MRELPATSARYANIFLDLSFPTDGYITKWRYFAQRSGEFVSAVWRPLINDSYQLIAKDYIAAPGRGVWVSIIKNVFKHINHYEFSAIET